MNSHYHRRLVVGLLCIGLVGALFGGDAIAFGQSIGVPNSIQQVLDQSKIYLPIIYKSASAEQLLVQRFAPVLKFDASTHSIPMSAEVYFREMMNVPGVSPVIEGDTIYWQTERYPAPDGLFPDKFGWDDPQYYSTIQAADVDGDGQAELLARGACGMETWQLNVSGTVWEKMGGCNPDWGSGWGYEKYYSTIQTADIDGDGQAELLARGACGMETWHFNKSSQIWEKIVSCSPNWSDAAGWSDPHYYLTIQTADVDIDGRAELLARSACGMETWHLNIAGTAWEKIISCSPNWSDANGWSAPQYYFTIQTADINNDGRPELLARSACGMETWHLNVAGTAWEKITSCSPNWSDAAGWNDPLYYSTIQTADVEGEGQAELLARSACGMETWHFNTTSLIWEKVGGCNPSWSDAAGWNDPQYYRTIQAADVEGDGQAELLARGACGMETWHFNKSSQIWEKIVSCSPDWSEAEGWGNPQYYSTIQTADVDGDGRPELMARGAFGLSTYKYTGEHWIAQILPKRMELCGRDDCQFGMSNKDFNTLTNGQVPTYYRVIYGSDGRARIAYWWFYGWQPHCSVLQEGDDGAHHGDWEHILVTTSEDKSHIDYVTYFFHSSSYTRQSGSFEQAGERPVVYVGKLGHGSYHSQDCSGWMAGDWHHCCEYADYRNPNEYTVWDTHLNLVDLGGNSESWMLADRTGALYNFNGVDYTITNWNWGPLHAYCNVWIGGCVDWEHSTGVSTHPTVARLDWTIPSCNGEGCNTNPRYCKSLVYDCNTQHNQGWPWDTLSSSPAPFVDAEASCGGP
jgi:hypothetical protein